MLSAAIRATPKQESVSLETRKNYAQTLTQELGLVLEGITMIPTRVETTLTTVIHPITEARTSKQWDIS